MTIRIVLLFLIASMAATPALAQTSTARQPAATILSRTAGAVFVKPGSADEKPARTDDPLFSDDAIRTAKGYAQLLQVAKPKAQYQLNPESRVSLSVLDGGGDFRTRLERGTMIVREATAGRVTPRDCARRASGTKVEVPDGGTATGCGTEWSIQISELDSAGIVTVTVAVPDGAVELENSMGKVTVRENYLGQMRRGEKPQELRLIQPADRVQFVEYYEASAASYAAAGVEAGETDKAIDSLAKSITASSRAEEHLALVDLLLAAGDYAGARDRASKGGAQYPANGRFDAMRAQVELLAGDENWYELGKKYADAATTKSPFIVDGWLVSGQLGYRGGDAARATKGFTEATKIAPTDPRAYLGLSTVATELEDLALARRHLGAAAQNRADSPAYLGQLGTLEGLENRLRSAHTRFDELLAKAPNDYVARTGKALVSLKQGDGAAAETQLLRTTLLQPRYARAHQLMAVAHYRQDGFADAALSDLKRAMDADTNDPVPYFLKAMIDADYFRPAAAMDAARQAQRKLPYLKSLNQVANNQKGTANLGNTFAFVGLEDWAEHFAQESYLSSWAGSHFFLGDRYPGRFNKNSEYVQGLLTDPTTFGAATRFEALVQRPGTYLTAGTRMEVDNYDPRFLDTSPYVTLNGYNNARIPVAYFLNGSRQDGRYLGNTDERLKQTVPYGTAAIGLRPTPKLNVFATVTANQLKGRYTSDQGPFDDDYRDHKVDVGLQYRFGPRSMIWARAGQSKSTLTGTFTEGLLSGDSDDGESLGDRVRGEEYQFRQTLKSSRHEFSWGLEAARRPRVLNFVETRPRERLVSRNTFTTRSEVAYIADRFEMSKMWLLDALVAVTRSTDADTSVGFEDVIDQIDVAPRVGLVGRFGPERLIRLSYQDWVRPASDSTLAPVAIAGLPMDDRLVDYVGRLKATRAQVEWGWNTKTFMKGFVTREKVVDREFATPANAPTPPQNALRALERIRNRTLTNAATSDLYEGSALYAATVDRAGLSINQVIGFGIAASARYERSDSRDDVDFIGPHAPYTPRHMTVLGATWVSPLRFYVSGQAVHRTARLVDFFDDARPADWEANVIAYWELPNKRWSLEVRATDLLPRGNNPLIFSTDLKFRY